MRIHLHSKSEVSSLNVWLYAMIVPYTSLRNARQSRLVTNGTEDVRSTSNRHSTRSLSNHLRMREHERERKACYYNRRSDEPAKVDGPRAVVFCREVIPATTGKDGVGKGREDERQGFRTDGRKAGRRRAEAGRGGVESCQPPALTRPFTSNVKTDAPTRRGSQFAQSAQERMTSRKPTASTKERRMTAARRV